MNLGAETARKSHTKIKVKRDTESEEHGMSVRSRREAIRVDGELEREQRRRYHLGQRKARPEDRESKDYTSSLRVISSEQSTEHSVQI